MAPEGTPEAPKRDAAYYAQLVEKYKRTDPAKADAARVMQNRIAFDMRQENAASAVEQAKELLGEEA